MTINRESSKPAVESPVRHRLESLARLYRRTAEQADETWSRKAETAERLLQQPTILTCRDFGMYVTPDHDAADTRPELCYCHADVHHEVEPCFHPETIETELPGVFLYLCCRCADEILSAFAEHERELPGFWTKRAHKALIERARRAA